MMGSEMAVNQLLALLDGALEKVTLLEKEIDVCDAILAVGGFDQYLESKLASIINMMVKVERPPLLM